MSIIIVDYMDNIAIVPPFHGKRSILKLLDFKRLADFNDSREGSGVQIFSLPGRTYSPGEVTGLRPPGARFV
jgi:hypothetical protein